MGVWEIYSAFFDKVIPINEENAHQALVLRAATPGRLPTIDGLIAATASVHDLTLVHRDPHFAAIPAQHLKQLQLSEK